MKKIMSESKTSPLLVYIYLDAQGIASLYAQTTDRVEIEFTEGHSRQGRGEVGLKLGFGNLLSSLLGLREAGAETRLEELHGHIDKAKTTLTVELKLQQQSDYLTKTRKCFGSLEDAANSISERGGGAYVRAIEKFDAPDFQRGVGGITAINSSGAVVFTLDPKYDPSERYFKQGRFHFVMPASLKKFSRCDGYMGATSHDAIMFRGFSGRDIPLGLFGYVTRHSEIACQVKPYAIWLPNS